MERPVCPGSGGTEERGGAVRGDLCSTYVLAAKRTKEPARSLKNMPENFEKPLDTHGRVLYDNGASEKGRACDDAGDCSEMR